jgi:hypothetical protein
MFCTACGRQLQDDDRFCGRCGQPVSSRTPKGEEASSLPQVTEDVADSIPPVIRTSRSTAEMHKPLTSAPPHAPIVPEEPAGLSAHDAGVEQVPKISTPLFVEPSNPLTSAEHAPPPKPVTEVPPAVPIRRYEPMPPTFDHPQQRRFRVSQLVVVLAMLLLAGGIIALLLLNSEKGGDASSGVEVTVSPANAEVVAGNALDFTARVSGSNNPEVSWSVQEGDAGGRVVPRGAQASGGQVSLMVVYVAPETAGTYHLLATSKADRRKSASAEITVKPR